jgi:Mrp family chromosome partitioning ATPase
MSNIYEALEQAQRERHGIEVKEIAAAPKDEPKADRLVGKGHESSAARREVDVATLYRNIDILLPECPKRTIQFISTQEGEGVSTIVRDMARTAADHLGKKVLVLDAAHHNPTQHKFHNVCCNNGWNDIAKNGGAVDEACYRTINPNLFISPLTRSTASNPYFVDIQASVSFLDEVKKRFDLILIDSAPAAVAPDSIALSRYADGVILVIEAERTRWAAAENLRDRILKNGGTILGVVFNKRRYHIPNRIYRWLYC